MVSYRLVWPVRVLVESHRAVPAEDASVACTRSSPGPGACSHPGQLGSGPLGTPRNIRGGTDPFAFAGSYAPSGTAMGGAEGSTGSQAGCQLASRRPRPVTAPCWPVCTRCAQGKSWCPEKQKADLHQRSRSPSEKRSGIMLSAGPLPSLASPHSPLPRVPSAW